MSPGRAGFRRAGAAALMLGAVMAMPGPGGPQAQAQAQDTIAARGEEAYTAKCSFCHDRVPAGTALPMLPGVASLALKYGDRQTPYISERPDLANAAVLTAYLRAGAGSMPPFRKTEVTDADIAAIAAYFRQTSAD